MYQREGISPFLWLENRGIVAGTVPSSMAGAEAAEQRYATCCSLGNSVKQGHLQAISRPQAVSEVTRVELCHVAFL